MTRKLSDSDVAALAGEVQRCICDDLRAAVATQMQQIEAFVDKTRCDILKELQIIHSPPRQEAMPLLEPMCSRPSELKNEFLAEVTPAWKACASLKNELENDAATIKESVTGVSVQEAQNFARQFNTNTPSLKLSVTSKNALGVDLAILNKERRDQWDKHNLAYFSALMNEHGVGPRIACMQWLGFDLSAQHIPHSALSRFVHGVYFKFVVIITIVTDCVLLAYETQYIMEQVIKAPNDAQENNLAYGAVACSCVYAIELALRIWSDRLAFVFGSDWGWNVFDFSIVLSSVVDLILDFDVSHVRALRIPKLLAAFRVAKLFRFFKGLRDVIASMRCSVVVFLWGMVMILLINFMTSIIIMQSLAAQISMSGSVSSHTQELWGTLENSMTTLFGCLTGGMDWMDAEVPLHHHRFLRYIFLCWAAFMIIGMMSILIGVFMDKAMSASVLYRDIATENQKGYLSNCLREIRQMFHMIDTDGCGYVTWDTFRSHIEDPDVKAFLLSRGFNVMDAQRLFQHIDELDDSPDDQIDLESFSLAMMRLMSDATGSDFYMILQECRKQTEILLDVVRTCTDTLSQVENAQSIDAVKMSSPLSL